MLLVSYGQNSISNADVQWANETYGERLRVQVTRVPACRRRGQPVRQRMCRHRESVSLHAGVLARGEYRANPSYVIQPRMGIQV